MATMDDLKEAIFMVLGNAILLTDTNYRLDGFLVPEEELRILQAEYNIHFVEPEDDQLDVL